MKLTRYPPRFEWRDRQCYYLDPHGGLLTPVSAILSATKTLQEWAQLKAWRERVGEAEATRICRESTTRGKELHRRIERYLLKRSLPPCPESLVPWRDSIAPVLKELHHVHLVEGAVFHHGQGYAGTVDAIAEYEQQGLCLFDWKTATSLRKEEWIRGYKLQVAALWGAIQATYGLTLEKAAIVVALPQQEAQLFWLDLIAIQDLWLEWEAKIQQWRENTENAVRENL
ncbi:hypothetical protein NDI52_29175 [Leptolyngbya sp. PL-A3]|uniref:exonuclease n=1 Tax=Leptolyngbya sp. PL-A3 TaxID=2933911 RepID=UPI003296E710